jgi:hypothetical protein
MAPRLVPALVVGAALAAAPGAVGKAPLGGVDVCGVGDACVHLSQGDAEQVWIRTTNSSAGPAAPARFYVVRWQGPGEGVEQSAYYVPSAAVMRFVYPGNPQVQTAWRDVEPAALAVLERAARGLTAFAPAAPTRVTVGGRSVRGAATYLRLFEGRHVWTWPSTRWLRVTLEAVEPSPWTDGFSEVTLATRPGYVSVDGWVYRIPKALALRALKGLPLTHRR